MSDPERMDERARRAMCWCRHSERAHDRRGLCARCSCDAYLAATAEREPSPAAEEKAVRLEAERDIVLRKCAQELRDKAEQLRRKPQDTGAWEWAARLLERFAEQWERGPSENPPQREGFASGSNIVAGATTQNRWRGVRAAGRFLRASTGDLLVKCGSAKTAAELASVLDERDALRAENARLAAELRDAQAATRRECGLAMFAALRGAEPIGAAMVLSDRWCDDENHTTPAEPAARHEEE